jgi:hypothetical protein
MLGGRKQPIQLDVIQLLEGVGEGPRQHVSHVRRRDGVSTLRAMQTARRERPDLFADHQATTGSVEQEHAHRRAMNKSEHVHGDTCYEDMVAIECSKGFSPDLAAQRVLHAYGDRLPHRNDAMSKAADTLVTRFMKRVDQTMVNECCDRNTAMRKVRQQDPDLYECFQLV